MREKILAAFRQKYHDDIQHVINALKIPYTMAETEYDGYMRQLRERIASSMKVAISKSKAQIQPHETKLYKIASAVQTAATFDELELLFKDIAPHRSVYGVLKDTDGFDWALKFELPQQMPQRLLQPCRPDMTEEFLTKHAELYKQVQLLAQRIEYLYQTSPDPSICKTCKDLLGGVLLPSLVDERVREAIAPLRNSVPKHLHIGDKIYVVTEVK